MDPTRDLGLLMATAYDAYVDALHVHLVAEGHEVQRPDGYLFRILHDQGSATVSELAEIFGVTKQAASQAVQSLTRRGFAVVEADGSDGRRRLVRLSAEGEAARRCAIAFADGVEDDLTARLGPRKAAALRDGLEALLDTTADRHSPLVRRLATIGR